MVAVSVEIGVGGGGGYLVECDLMTQSAAKQRLYISISIGFEMVSWTESNQSINQSIGFEGRRDSIAGLMVSIRGTPKDLD